MPGLWDTGTKKSRASSMWGGEDGKSVYETYGGKEEDSPRVSFDDLTDEEKKLISGYNDKVKNEKTFKKSREIFNKILNDPENKDYEIAQRIAPYIAQNEKDVKFTENGFMRGLHKVGDFAEASNDRFFGGILGGVSDATTWATGKAIGANDDVIKQSQEEVKSRFGISDAQLAEKDEKNKDNAWYNAGQVAGDTQRIATDIATTVIPGAAAEKFIRGTALGAKLASGGRVAKTTGDVVANVGSGLVSTAVGVAKDPTQLTAENVGTNTAIDAGLGVAGGLLGTIAGKVRQAKNASELAKALDEVDTAALPKKYADQLNKLQGSQLSGKQFQAELNKVMDEARSAKKFEVLSDGATAKNANIKTRLEDIDRRMSEVDTPEYQANNGLMNTEAAQAKYDELMADVTKIPGVAEASKSLQEADDQIKYYNDIRVKDPFARKVDKIRDKIAKIEQAKQAELDNLARMSEDAIASEVTPTGVRVYHGSNRKMEGGKPRPGEVGHKQHGRKVKSEMVFFSDNKDVSDYFAKDRTKNLGGKENITEYDLEPSELLDLTKLETDSDLIAALNDLGYKQHELYVQGGDWTNLLDTPVFKERLLNAGYKGVKFNEKGGVTHAVVDTELVTPMDEFRKQTIMDPAAFDELNAEATKKYDDMIATEQAKIDELMASNPEKAAELQMLDEAEKTVTQQKMDAQQALDDITAQQAELAQKEADKIAQTPNEEKIAQHKALLEEEKTKLNQRYEDAQKRFENPNKSLKDVDEELMYMQDGTHPLIADGASKEKQFKRYVELNNERATLQAKEIASSNPDIPKTVGEQSQVLDDALQEVATAKVGLGAKIGRIWSQPANQLRAAGFEQLADIRTDAVIKYNRQAFDIKETIKEWGKLAKGNSTKDLFRAANGDAKAYEKITPGARKVIDEWRKQAYDMGKAMGLPEEVLAKGDYIPHLFTDVKRNPRLLDLQKKLVNAQKKATSGLDERALAKNAKHIEKLQESIREITDNPGIVTAQDFIQETGEYSNRFLKERYGAEGYEEDFWKAVDAYMNAANTKINLEPVMETFAKAKGLTPEKGMQKFLQTEIEKMRGTKADVDRGLDDWFNSLTGKTSGDKMGNLGTKSLRGFRSAMSLSHIGFSATSAINTLSQVAIMPGSINIDGSLYGMAKAMELTAKLGKNTLTRAETSEFKMMARMGVFEGSSHILPEQTLNKYANKFNKAAYSGITGADRYLRMSTYYGAKLKAERQGLKGIDAERYIYERVNEVNQNFSKLEAPHAFRSQVAKTLGSMITFVPGMVVRSVEIGAKSLKGAGDIIGHTAKGQPITRAEFMKDVDDISKGIFTAAAVWGVGNVIGGITGQDEVVPNPLNAQTYSSPALQFIFGSEYKTGVIGAFTNQSGDRYDENGNNITRNERTKEFWTELMPSMLIPGYSQGKRTKEGLEINEKGYSETDKGGIRYMTDPDHDLQRAIFGQYSTPEGREYINNMGRPGGGALTESESMKIKDAPVGLKNQYYDFFRETDKITGRTSANKEVTQLFKGGRPQAARRKADEYNRKVDEKLSEFFSKYPDIDYDLQDELRSNVYITLTDSSEDARRGQ